MQASAKLSAQAKELADLQRQVALEGRRSGRRVASPSPPRKANPRHPLGTRMSARLRGATQDDDVWQEIPDDWLKGGVKENHGELLEKGDDREAEMGVNSEPDTELDLHPEPEPNADTDTQLAKTGLESDDDAVSELTELSEITPPATVVATRPKSRRSSKKSSGTRKKPSHFKGQTLTSAPEDEIEPEWRLPEGFIEWETVRYFLMQSLPSGLDNNQLSRYVLPCTNGSTFVNTSKGLRITRRRRCTSYFLSKLCPLSLRSFG